MCSIDSVNISKSMPIDSQIIDSVNFVSNHLFARRYILVTNLVRWRLKKYTDIKNIVYSLGFLDFRLVIWL